MSEYQYYEFQALDRALTQEQMSKLRAYSSRAHITPYSFVNVYNWGDFKGNPSRWMEQYFDAFLYFANWGSRQFMLRLPKKLLDSKAAAAYCADRNFSYRQKDDHIVLSFEAELEDYQWADGQERLGSLVPIRSNLMRGDHRALYLGWLLAVQFQEVGDDAPEPPVPPGLGDLDASLNRLADFLGIDADLIAAAAEHSPGGQVSTPSREEIGEWVRILPSAEKDAIVMRLIAGDDPHLWAEVRQRALLKITGGRRLEGRGRTAGEILARAATIAGERKKKEVERRAREEARRKRAEAEERKKRLESLAGKENDLWATVERLIGTKQPRRYDEAVSLLQDLRDLAEVQGKGSDFRFGMGALQRANSGKSTLIERFRKAKLPD